MFSPRIRKDQAGPSATSADKPARRNSIRPAQEGPGGVFHDAVDSPELTTRPAWDFGKMTVSPPDRIGSTIAGDGNFVHHLLNARDIQAKLTISSPGDIYEREADRVADHVMRSPEPETSHIRACGGRCPKCQKQELAQTKRPAEGAASIDRPLVEATLRGPGKPLEPATRTFMESRFGHDFERVRIHADGHAAESARSISARAYTKGEHIVFGEGEYAPSSEAGRRLLAHELTHTVQQTSGSGSAAPSGVVQRAPTVTIFPEDFVGPLLNDERRAAKSCPVTCCGNPLGTLHAMPLFFHQNRRAIVEAGSPQATGIGAELHFIAEKTQSPATGPCHCDDFRIIQIVTTNAPDDPRKKNDFVDNDAGATPFYGDAFGKAKGEHQIPKGFVDAGEWVDTTESIYDTPTRKTDVLGPAGLKWMAETCVTCIKKSESEKPDRVLGCVTYGFSQNYKESSKNDPSAGMAGFYKRSARNFDPVVAVAPSCPGGPSANFVNTLSTDSSTSSYKFKSPPEADECNLLKNKP